MRTLFRLSVISVVVALSHLVGFSQTSTTPLPLGSPGSVGAYPEVWQSTIKDWHSTDWQTTAMVTNPVTGHFESQVVRKFTEVGGGINYINPSGQWQRSEDTIEISTNSGGAVALHGPTKVYFSPTVGLDGPTIRIVSSSGVVLQVRPMAIDYVDGSGNSALLANIRPDATGELVPPNRVVYRSITTNGLACDLVYTYTHGVFESDLLILSQPAKTPDMLGLDASTARISLIHLVTGPLPNLTALGTPTGIADERMDFAGLSFPQGYAFSTGDSSDASGTPNPGTPGQVQIPGGASSSDRIPVAKRIIPIGLGQWGLAEEMLWEEIKTKLEALPPYRQGASLSTPAPRPVLDGQTPPSKKKTPPTPKPMKMATAAYGPKAVDLDFITVFNATNYTFASGQTYFLSGPVTFSGTVNFYGSCVIKETNGASLTLSGPVNCYGTAMNPSIITSFSDWAFGENSLPGSTGYPKVSGNPALKVTYATLGLSLTGLKIRWAQTALDVEGTGSGPIHALANSSFEWSTNGIVANGCTLNISTSSKCTVTTPTSGTATITGSLPDECGGSDNGLPQSWEFEYFGTTGISASGDPDGDGLSNLAEYTAGTNPNVYDGPRIQSQPQSQTLVVGDTASFNVGATGTGTLKYQWYKGGQPISGGTASTFAVLNIQLKDCDNYFVVVTNSYGVVSSSLAFLSVAIATNGVPAPYGIVAWWPGNGNANDAVSTNNGSFSGTYINAEVGQGFNVQNSSTFVRIPAAPALNIGTNNGLTVEGWIENYDNVPRPVFEWGTTNSYGVLVWVNWPSSGVLYADVVDTSGGYHSFQSGGPRFTANSFLHVALTYDKTSGTGTLYLNGAVVATSAIGTITPQTSFDFYLGYRPYSTGTPFNGIVDEASLYNRVLEPNEILGIYTAGSYGKLYPMVAAPTITSDPQGTVGVPPGSTTNFTVTASGPTPFGYQWMFNGNPIAGATASSYTITNVQLANRGLYSVVVANTGGSTRSRNAYLSLSTDAYNYAIIPSNIISWWRAEGNANDTWGTNNGQWQGTANYTNGEVAQGFRFNGTSGNYVQIADSGSLQLTNQFTLEFWYNDTGLANGAYGGMVAKRPLYGACNFGISMLAGTPNEELLIYFLDPNYNSGNYQAIYYTWQPARAYSHHVAATFNQINATQIEIKLYVDSLLAADQTFSGNLTNTLSTAPVTIGASNYNGEWFVGMLDEVSIYSRALNINEISNIYNATVSGKSYIPITIGTQPQSTNILQGSTLALFTLESGTLPMTFQWRFNGSPIAGVSVDEMWITNIQPANAGDYVLVASNVVGAVTSAVAVVNVLCPPSIVVPPANQEAPLFANLTFTVTASGTPLLSYQWNLDGLPIPGATNNTFNIPNVQLANYGNYSVLVTNLYGTALSTNAALSYASPCTPAPSGIVAWWPAEANATDVIGTNNGIFAGAYTNGEAGQAFTITNGSTVVRIPATGSLNVGAGGGLTVEGWIYP